MRALTYYLLCTSVLGFCLLPHYAPEFRPIFFSPYLASLFYLRTRERVLAHALLVGLFCDAGSSCLFGIHAFLYTTTSMLLYPLHKVFLKDKWISLPLISLCFAWIFAFLSYPLLAIFHQGAFYNLSSLILDAKHALVVDFPYSATIYGVFHVIKGNACSRACS